MLQILEWPQPHVVSGMVDAEVVPDAEGRALVWTARFEVHVDQVLALADSVATRRESA